MMVKRIVLSFATINVGNIASWGLCLLHITEQQLFEACMQMQRPLAASFNCKLKHGSSACELSLSIRVLHAGPFWTCRRPNGTFGHSSAGIANSVCRQA